MISIPLTKDIFIKAELVEILENNDAIVKLTFPEDTPIGSFELNWSVMDPYSIDPANTSQIINIVPEGYQDPGIDPIKRPTPINLGPNNTKLYKDINSGELLFADSSNTTDQTLLTNKDGSSFLTGTDLTAVDIEQDSDGTIKLLSYRERVKVGRILQDQLDLHKHLNQEHLNEEVARQIEEIADAGFVLTTFDSFGQLIQETTELNPADAATYDAEKLFGIDINGDNHQGRNVQIFDTAAYVASKNLTTFTGATNTKTLFTDINSGELLFADSSNSSNQTLLKK